MFSNRPAMDGEHVPAPAAHRKHKSGVERITQHRLTEAQSERNTSPHFILVAKWEKFRYNRGCGNSLYGYGVEWCITHHRSMAGRYPAMLRRCLCFHGYSNLWEQKLQGLFRKSRQKQAYPRFPEETGVRVLFPSGPDGAANSARRGRFHPDGVRSQARAAAPPAPPAGPPDPASPGWTGGCRTARSTPSAPPYR